MSSEPLGWHVMLRLGDGRVVAPDLVARRALATSLCRVAQSFRVLAFRAADTHVHLLAACDRAAAGRLAQAAEVSMGGALALPVGFTPAHFEPVRDQAHLHNAFHYVLRNPAGHGAAYDPLHDASALPDLLGMRVLAPWILPLVRERLPRLRSADLVAHLGIGDLVPSEDPTLLAQAAAAAVGLPSLEGRSARAVAARAAACHLGGPAWDAGPAFGGARTRRRLRTRTPDPVLLQAVRLQAGLLAAIRAKPVPPWTSDDGGPAYEAAQGDDASAPSPASGPVPP